ncbi:hypothetical protein EGW08_015098 [Elysia chlorotica]|uniref:Uncharacterized protein n=1 Tax=Elysia chlorotica TaxID=188477 RepID=A0A433T6R9_ELYCH|nr:hypothetical protein EGW08_015098 [Elysia chlorotica]
MEDGSCAFFLKVPYLQSKTRETKRLEAAFVATPSSPPPPPSLSPLQHPECPVYSISTSRSSPSSFMSLVTATSLTVPAMGALTTISIFMALRTSSFWPFSTVSPSLTLISMTVPGIGAPTEPRTLVTALGWMCISCREKQK